MEFNETFDINNIITDDDCLLHMQDSGSTVTKSAVTVKTNLQISNVCQSSANDKCLTPDDRTFFNQVYKDEILEKVQFLDDCLVPGKVFVRTSREKAWSLYHAAYIKNMSSVVYFTKSISTAAWLCRKTFEKLVALLSSERRANSGRPAISIR